MKQESHCSIYSKNLLFKEEVFKDCYVSLFTDPFAFKNLDIPFVVGQKIFSCHREMFLKFSEVSKFYQSCTVAGTEQATTLRLALLRAKDGIFLWHVTPRSNEIVE